MIKKQKGNKILAILTGVSLLFTGLGFPMQTVQVKADTVSDTPESPEIRNINLNLTREDGSYAIAGISDPGQPVNSQTEASAARNNSWGQETDADGNVTKSGSYVYYGSYRQSSDGDDSYLTEPLKWRVLDADTQDFNAEDDTSSHTMFLMSDKVLEQVNFNESKEDGGIYSTCNLRKWLNSEPFQGTYLEDGFLNNAFREPERKGIAVSSKGANDEIEIKTLVKDNCGLSQDGLTDKIFVLSAEEANSNIYGFYYLDGWGASKTRLLTATDYAKAKGICSTTTENKDWWLRSRVDGSSFSSALVDCTGWLWAGNVDCLYSDGSTPLVGVAPVFNMDLSSVRFTSAGGTDKASSFALTSASDSKEWNLTMAGGSGFKASRKSTESGVVSPGGEITVDIAGIGTPDNGVSYTQISAMLADSNNTVIAYGKIADIDVTKTKVTIPDQVADGDYILKIFAEEVNSSSQQNLTDFASNMVDISITVGDSYTIFITNPADSHITYSTTEENGTEQQGVLKDGGSYTKVVYNADRDYYFPEDYNIAGINGILVTRDNSQQITVSGVPTGDVNLILAAATEKDSQPAPEGLSESEGQITGTDTTMEYRIKPSAKGSPDTEWVNCTAGFTAATPGTYQIRYMETDTKKAGEITEITVLTRYTITITNPADSHITRCETAGNGTEQQKVSDGEAITSIAYTAEDGYYFSDNYSVTDQNGITVTRDSDTRITVSGIPTGDVHLLLTATTKKGSQPAPEGLSESEGQITGTDTTMEYRIKPSAESSPDTEWANCTAGFTAATPGTYQIRYKGTETKKASDITEITVLARYTIAITNPADSHITRCETADNGTEQQKVSDGEAIISIAYTAEDGYYFPENYSVTDQNGITVTRDSNTRITVSGIPTGDVHLTLTAATEKDSQPAPEGLSESEGQITGTDTTMEYRIKPSAESSPETEWANCTAGYTAATPGTYQIRYKGTETKKAGEITEITVLARYTIAITNPADSHITRSETAENGTEQQKVADGEAITSIVYTAEDRYYFPDNYSVTGQNGITVTRDSDTQITVSGIPTGDVNLILTTAVQKSPEEPTPTVTPGPDPTPTATPDGKPTPTATSPAVTQEPSAEPTPTVTPGPDPTPVATPDQKPTPTVTPPAATREPSEEPTPTVTPGSDPTPTATPDQKPTPTVTPPAATREPSEGPTPTVTPGPAPTPAATPDQKPTPTVTPPAATREPSEEPTPTVTPPVATQKPNTAIIEGYDFFAAPCGKKLNAKSLVKTVKGERSSAALAKIAGKMITGKKSYTIKIKPYQLVNGKKVYISGSLTYHVAGAKNKTYTNAKKVTVSKKSYKLKKGKTSRIKAKIVKQSKKKKLLPKSYGSPLRYSSTNAKIATVTSKGKIRGKKKGTCYIYITALNGVSTKVKITVK